MELEGKILGETQSVQFELSDVIGSFLDDDVLYIRTDLGEIPVIYSTIEQVLPEGSVTFEVTEQPVADESGITEYIASRPEDYDENGVLQPFAFRPKPAETPIGAIANLVSEMMENSHELEPEYLFL